jgi:hypothetical protein
MACGMWMPGDEGSLCAITGHTEQNAKKEAFRTYSKGAGMKELTQYI